MKSLPPHSQSHRDDDWSIRERSSRPWPARSVVLAENRRRRLLAGATIIAVLLTGACQSSRSNIDDRGTAGPGPRGIGPDRATGRAFPAGLWTGRKRLLPRGVRVSSGGTGDDAWYVFETGCRGWSGSAGGDHCARVLRVLRLRPVRGSDPAHRPGRKHRHLSALADRCRRSVPAERHRAVHERGGAGIRGALDHLASGNRTCGRSSARPATSASRSAASSPRTSRTAIGRSACPAAGDLPRRPARRWPRRRGEPALDDSMAGIPPSTCRVPLGAEGVLAEPGQGGRELQRGVPEAPPDPRHEQGPRPHATDSHGQPPLTSATGCAQARLGRPGQRLRLELLLEGLGRASSRAYSGTDCRYALGNTPAHRSIGRWSDGVAVEELTVQNQGSLRR